MRGTAEAVEKQDKVFEGLVDGKVYVVPVINGDQPDWFYYVVRQTQHYNQFAKPPGLDEWIHWGYVRLPRRGSKVSKVLERNSWGRERWYFTTYSLLIDTSGLLLGEEVLDVRQQRLTSKIFCVRLSTKEQWDTELAKR